uniref:DNA-directed RNA polymerase subunit n=1 Tax=Panagrolaimus davidi TaxID=227884 RepID=A0A914PP10_9BILA
METHFISNDDFCTLCGRILPLPSYAPCKITCEGCGNQWTVKEKKAEVVYIREKIYDNHMDSNDLAEDGEEGAATVDHVCSKCEHTRATYSTMQTRSADEGQTVFYKCLRCGRKDIEYS